MTITKKLELLEKAYTYNQEKEKYFLNDSLGVELEPIKKIQFEMDEWVKFDLGYEIMNDACNYITENIAIENLQNPDFDFRDELDSEFASVYTQTRLEYLNQWNQDEITEMTREYSVDIQTACAIWYDRQVEEVITKLIEWLQEK